MSIPPPPQRAYLTHEPGHNAQAGGSNYGEISQKCTSCRQTHTQKQMEHAFLEGRRTCKKCLSNKKRKRADKKASETMMKDSVVVTV
jgi:hypothetical protein